MNPFQQQALRLEEVGLRGLKEERTLRHALAFFAWTTASLFGSAAYTANLAADDAIPATGPANPAASASATKAAAAAPNDAHKKLALTILAEARRLAAAGRINEATLLAHRAQALHVTWLPGEKSPQQFLAEIAAGKFGKSTAAGDMETPVEKRRYFAALLDSARDDLQAGQTELARAKAAAARKIGVAYRFLDDRASRLLAQIDRLGRVQGNASGAGSEPAVIRAQSPSDADGGMENGVAAQKSGEAAGSISRPDRAALKQQAKQLMATARRAFEAGDYDEARINALKADELDVSWSMLEDEPKTLLREIERVTGTKILARKSTKAPAAADAADPRHTQAVELIKQARIDLQAGRLDAAYQKALTARQLNAVFGMFEDRPDTVLADVARARRLTAAKAGAAGSSNIPAAGASPDKEPSSAATAEKAQEMLRQARADLRAGRIEAAKRTVAAVAKMNVNYAPFDDRPELVQESIAIRESHQGGATDAGFGLESASGSGSNAEGGVNHAVAESPAPRSVSRMRADKARATELVQEARSDMTKGRIAQARQKAKQAAAIDVTYSVMEDRPELVLSDIERLEANGGSGNIAATSAPATAPAQPAAPSATVAATEPGPPPALQAPDAASAPPPLDAAAGLTSPAKPISSSPTQAFTGDNPFANKVDTAEISVIHPSGASSEELFEQGMQRLREGNRDAAYAAFLACYRSGQPLDRYRAHQLHAFLRDLAPSHGHAIRQVAAESEASGPTSSSRIDAVDQQRAIKFEKLRTDVLNAHFKAERLRETDPDKAKAIIKDAMDLVEKSELGKPATAPLTNLLTRSLTEIESQEKQQAPNIAQKQHNEQVEAEIERSQQYKLRVEQEFADLVEEYNKLVKQDRWAEAELIAKQAKELDRENPVATVMYEKARLGRQVARNTELKDRKSDAFIEQLWEVEDAAATGIYGKEIKFPKDWADITNRRKKFGGADNKERSEPEKEIEQSLSRPVSLHFQQVPLIKVIEHIQKIANVNVVLDYAGMEEEHVASSTPVTIDVDGIMLRSALNLILEPLNMGYMVNNEVLLITSHLRQQGKMELRTYPVADLVTPIPDVTPTTYFQHGLGGGSQWSVPASSTASATSPTNGQAFMQVGQAVGANPSLALNTPASNRPIGLNGTGPDFDSIKHLIVSTIEPESWDEAGGQGSIQTYDTTLSLVIRQTQRVHDEIRDLLQQLRRLQDLQITVEVRFITVDDDFFENVGVNFNFNLPDNVPQSKLGVGQFGSPVFSSSTSSTSGTSTSGSSSTSGSTGGTSTSSTSSTSTSSTSTSSTSTSALSNSAPPFFPLVFQQNGLQLNTPNTNNWPSKGTIVGMDSETTFSQDLNIPFRQGSFDIGIPQFGGFNPDAGMTVGLAILSDIEAFFFIRAAQGDTRTNIMFAPKVTLFNGQRAFVGNTENRPFVISVQPSVGVFAVGFTPQIEVIPTGSQLTVAAVVSADRRFVRLSVLPIFSQITDIFTFTFVSAPGQSGTTGMGPGASGSSGTTGSSGFGGGTSGSFGVGGIGGTTSTTSTTSTTTNSVAPGNITVQQPVVQIVNVTTTVSVPDGGTVLLGGIKTLREGRNMAGVPILSEIPYLSRLFRNTGIGRETESLMMMVTPRIIIQEEEEELLEGGTPP